MEFIPTYLYIKQHSITGLLYFGKTISKDPIKYLGSGMYWQNHITKHGIQHVVTLWYELFNDKDELTSFALHFSKSMSIVKSNQWANLIDENGCGGFSMTGKHHTKESIDKISMNRRGHQAHNKGRPHTENTKQKISRSRLKNISYHTPLGIFSENEVNAKTTPYTKDFLKDWCKNNERTITRAMLKYNRTTMHNPVPADDNWIGQTKKSVGFHIIINLID